MLRLAIRGSEDCFTIDDEDFEKVKNFKWCLSVGGYLRAHPKFNEKHVLIHRLIMNAPKGTQVDHIDGNPLNNCKSNLRLCTNNWQNTVNRKKPHRGVTFYKGVHPDKTSRPNPYFARIRQKYLGNFPTQVEAAIAYDLAAIKEWKGFARTNFFWDKKPRINKAVLQNIIMFSF